MKRLITLSVFFLFSCHDKKEAQKPTLNISEEDSLLKMVNLYPDSVILRENLIQYFRDQENFVKALDHTDKGIRADSNNHRMWYIKGILESESSDTSAAIASLEKAASLDPNADYLLRLANLYALTGNSKAIRLADELTRFDIAAEKILYIKGVYYLALKDAAKGIGFMDKALELNFTFMEAYREKAIALYDQQKYEGALQVLNKAVTLQNSFEEGYYYIGMCLEKLNRNEEAADAYQKALMYDPQYEEAKTALQRIEKINK